MKVTAEVKALCVAELKRCHAAAEAHFDRKFKIPTMTYTKRGGSAGSYNHDKKLIKINPILLMENVKYMVEDTVSHEFAHHVDVEVHGRQYGTKRNRRTGRYNRIVHGPTFKAIQRVFGRSTETFHTMDVSNAKVKRTSQPKHIWTCNCGQESGTMKIGAIRHNKMMDPNTKARYWMRGHGRHTYTYQGVEGAAPVAQLPMAARAPKPAKRSTGVTKLAQCRAVFDNTADRAHNIQLFIIVGCTPAGAATYYAKINKEQR